MNSVASDFSAPPETLALLALREQVRTFLSERLADEPRLGRPLTYLGRHDAVFSRDVAARGWVGMSFPRDYGGSEAGIRERQVVLEELVAARAPIGAHFLADRQSGPMIVRFGSPAQKRLILPSIAAGECFFCVGLSEPGAGSDLAAVRTRARRVDGGWRIRGTKLWTSSAHRSHYMMLLCRTRDAGVGRHEGLSQFILDLKSEGVKCRPFANMAGEVDFNEVLLEDVFVPDAMLLGAEGEGWSQVTSELAFERSGPERYLSSLGLMEAFAQVQQTIRSASGAVALGRMAARLHLLRSMSRAVAGMLDAGHLPALEAALIKDLGTEFEQWVPTACRDAMPVELLGPEAAVYAHVFRETLLRSPSCSIRGGTREILRGIVARGLGVR